MKQVGFAGLRAAVLGGQTAPGQFAPLIVVFPLPRFQSCGARREGATHHRLAAVAEHLCVDTIATFDVLKKFLSVIRALVLEALRPLFG